jgi:NusA-like KH domain protein
MNLGKDEIFYFKALERVSGVGARDCLITNGTVSFVVGKNRLGTALGKNGENARELRKILRKGVEIFEFDSNPKKFFSDAFRGMKFDSLETRESNGKKVLVARLDAFAKHRLLNSGGKLRRVKDLLNRSYGIKEVQIR